MSYMMKPFRWLGGLILLIGGLGCSTEFDLTAPPKDIWAVYGTLYPGDTTQFIRISKAFLPESDAFEFAAENDLSVPDLQVTLTEQGTGKVLTAVQVDSVPKAPEDGLFYPTTTLYKFRTIGTDRLKADTQYDLTVIQPGNETFRLSANTLIPATPEISTPGFRPGPGGTRCLELAQLEAPYRIFFKESQAAAYEIRVFLDYLVDGEERQAVFGPTERFTDDVRCSSAGSICFEFSEKIVINSFLQQINPQFGSTYRYEVDDSNGCRNSIDNLPKVFNFEVTAMDQHISRYRQVGSLEITDFSSLSTQYTNVEGSGDVLAVGILGSYETGRRNARLSPCTEYLLGLNGTPQPGAFCQF